MHQFASSTARNLVRYWVKDQRGRHTCPRRVAASSGRRLERQCEGRRRRSAAQRLQCGIRRAAPRARRRAVAMMLRGRRRGRGRCARPVRRGGAGRRAQEACVDVSDQCEHWSRRRATAREKWAPGMRRGAACWRKDQRCNFRPWPRHDTDIIWAIVTCMHLSSGTVSTGTATNKSLLMAKHEGSVLKTSASCSTRISSTLWVGMHQLKQLFIHRPAHRRRWGSGPWARRRHPSRRPPRRPPATWWTARWPAAPWAPPSLPPRPAIATNR